MDIKQVKDLLILEIPRGVVGYMLCKRVGKYVVLWKFYGGDEYVELPFDSEIICDSRYATREHIHEITEASGDLAYVFSVVHFLKVDKPEADILFIKKRNSKQAEIKHMERPYWCPHPSCKFKCHCQHLMCVGELPEPIPHDGIDNTHRLCFDERETGHGIHDMQLNWGDAWNLTRILKVIQPGSICEASPPLAATVLYQNPTRTTFNIPQNPDGSINMSDLPDK